jgi:hypothetical protein
MCFIDLRKEDKLQMFENGVLRRLFAREKAEVSEQFRIHVKRDFVIYMGHLVLLE